jgi:two-component system chemotaxis sensor kinase CheA
MDEIKEAFIEESGELFENISAVLIKAEENGTLSNGEINDLFRYIHTLKGGAGSIGFDKFAKITHIFETFMDLLRGGN